MRTLFWLSVLLVLPAALLVIFVFLATSAAPAIPAAAELVVRDLERGREVVSGLGLKNLREGEVRVVRLTEDDVEKGVNFALSRLGGGAAKIDISADALNALASLHIPGLNRYLNVRFSLQPNHGLLVPTRLKLGAVPLPAEPVTRMLIKLLALSPMAQQVSTARDMLRTATLIKVGGRPILALQFVWHGQALKAAMEATAGIDGTAIQAYRAALSRQKHANFANLMTQAFALAKNRSQAGNAVQENRAALTVLAEIALGTSLSQAAGVSGNNLGHAQKKTRRSPVRLAGREDFAQHFSLSAFLAATGGTQLSDLVGVYKELKDARGGSGFSFNDLAADRAGSRLGEVATRSDEDARRIQAVLAAGVQQATFFPRVDDLPEFMQQAEFERRYGGVGAPAYQAMADKIEARINSLKLYR